MPAVPLNDFLGLVGDDNPHSVAPPGSLDVAKNVVFRRQNVIEPRPGFAHFESESVLDEGGEA